jgi:PHD/YefM family antitoxin component YafN of YafNO toxin-antitoxin module
MLTDHTSQSVAEFSRTAAETLDRLNATKEAEVLTVDGEPRAVLIAPEVWRQVSLEYDLKTIRQAIKESAEGKGRDVREVFGELRAKLLAMKAAEEAAGSVQPTGSAR